MTKEMRQRLINLFIDYETFGEHQKSESGIFDFLRTMPAAVLTKTPYKIYVHRLRLARSLQPVSAIHVPDSNILG